MGNKSLKSVKGVSLLEQFGMPSSSSSRLLPPAPQPLGEAPEPPTLSLALAPELAPLPGRDLHAPLSLTDIQQIKIACGIVDEGGPSATSPALPGAKGSSKVVLEEIN